MRSDDTNVVNNNPVANALAIFLANRVYCEDKRRIGVQRVDLVVADVDGDWLEQWGEESEALPLAVQETV